MRDRERQILSKYPLERAITAPSESPDLPYQVKDAENQFEPNNFYRFLRSIGLTPKDIKLIFSSVNNIDNLPEVVFKITSKKEMPERIKRVLNEFPQSRDDFHKLQTIFKGVE